MRPHMWWMVLTQAESTLSASSARPASRKEPRMRSLISPAAFSVKVMMRAWSRLSRKGLPSCPEPGHSAHTMRRVRVKVLPEPAPAATKTGLSSVVTMRRCSGLRPSNRLATSGGNEPMRSCSLTSASFRSRLPGTSRTRAGWPGGPPPRRHACSRLRRQGLPRYGRAVRRRCARPARARTVGRRA